MLSHSDLHHVKTLQPVALNDLTGDVSKSLKESGFKALGGDIGTGPLTCLSESGVRLLIDHSCLKEDV